VLFYTVASLRNRGRAQLRRLRSPRALVAVAAGGGYIWWFLIRPAAAGGAPPMLGGPAWAPRLVALGLTLLAATWWFARPAGGGGLGAAPGAAGSAGGSGPARALAFTPAEEHLLFPAPVSRRGLVRWKLWRAQLAILVNTLIWTVLLRGGGGEPGAWRRALAVWALVSALFLHRLGAALVTGGWQARAAEEEDAALDAAAFGEPANAGRRLWRLRRLLPAALFALAAAALVWAAVADRAGLAAAWDAGLARFLATFGATLDRPAARAALWPAATLTAPLFAARGGTAEWARAMGPAVALLAVHYLWVLRTDAAVHEVALAAGERWRAVRRGGVVAGGDAMNAMRVRRARRPGLARWAPPMPTVGPPAVALVWKNLVAAARAVALARVLVMYAVVAAGVLVVAARTPRLAELAGVVAGVWGAMLVLAGPVWVRVDLRHDLVHLPFLRAAPLSGRAVVAAEVAASVVALTALQLAAFGLLLGASFGARDGFGMTVEERLAGARAFVLALPGVNAALLTVHNAAALLFPAWVRAPGAGPRGIESMGQNLVLTALTVAAAAVILLPAAVVAWGAWWAVGRVTGGAAGPWALAPAAVVGTLAALTALAPVVAWLGGVFDRTDPPAAADVAG
jgi:hypothetical protein